MDKEKNIFVRLRHYLHEVRGEVKKVTWPSRDDLVKTTIAVFVASIFFGVFLFVVDFVFSRLLDQVKALFK